MDIFESDKTVTLKAQLDLKKFWNLDPINLGSHFLLTDVSLSIVYQTVQNLTNIVYECSGAVVAFYIYKILTIDKGDGTKLAESE